MKGRASAWVSGGVLALLVLGLLSFESGCGETHERGVVEASITAAPGSLDPALAADLPAVESLWVVYTPLLTYRHAEGRAGVELIPGLAKALPRVSADGRTYRLTLRHGLRYSDGAPVKASDFEHTIKRVLDMNSFGSPFFSGIVGAEAYAKGSDPSADIAGIETDNGSGEITVRLVAPDATFSNVLATDFAGVVPGDTPFTNQSADPPAGVGAFAITDVAPGRGFTLKRNGRFALSGIPAAAVDRIDVRVNHNPTTQAEDVMRGKADYMQDAPPPDLIDEVKDRHGDRFRVQAVPGTTFFFLNQRLPPFDDPAVRRAVNVAVSREAMARIYGGLMEPSCNFLPRQIPGYEPIEPCPYGDPNGPGDLRRARKLVERAGAAGAGVKIVAPNEGPDRDAATAFADVLDRIGLDPEIRQVSFSSYFSLIGNADTKAQAGPIGFIEDFPHPADFLGQFSGAIIAPVGNFNFGNVDDPWLTGRIEALKRRADLSAVEGAWAGVDRRLVENGDVVVIGHPKRTTFLSDRMGFGDCAVLNPVFQNDYSRFCFAGG